MYTIQHIQDLLSAKEKADLKIYTLGKFNLELDGQLISDNWGRDKAIQLFQFFLISRNRTALHKEQIIDRLWEEDGSDQDFKVSLHGINKVLEPNKKTRGQSKYFIRQGSSYKMNLDHVWIDSQTMESLIEIGNASLSNQPDVAMEAFEQAVKLYKGVFLPNRIYEDWTTTEREKLQMLALSAHISLASHLLEDQTNEAIRLMEEALNIDHTWEEAYRIQMMGHMLNGNRPQALRTYKKCVEVLEEEFGISPLPATKQIYDSIKNA